MAASHILPATCCSYGSLATTSKTGSVMSVICCSISLWYCRFVGPCVHDRRSSRPIQAVCCSQSWCIRSDFGSVGRLPAASSQAAGNGYSLSISHRCSSLRGNWDLVCVPVHQRTGDVGARLSSRVVLPMLRTLAASLPELHSDQTLRPRRRCGRTTA